MIIYPAIFTQHFSSSVKCKKSYTQKPFEIIEKRVNIAT